MVSWKCKLEFFSYVGCSCIVEILSKTYETSLFLTYIWLFEKMYTFWFSLFQDASIGAQTAFHLASRKESEGKTGGCYFLCRQWVKPWGLQDAEFCRKIWKRSEELVNLAPNERIWSLCSTKKYRYHASVHVPIRSIKHTEKIEVFYL